ncbi:MAG TPA: beta-galactosidase GalB [Phycisphaerae bacterium]|nr:beta-galactosidase GalB [Phycisphaerae bacterium]
MAAVMVELPLRVVGPARCIAEDIQAPVGTDPANSPRQRISIDEGWSFIKGDPPDCPVSLLYDRMDPNAGKANTTSPATQEVHAESQPGSYIKQWILPTGNPFIKDPSKWFSRPEGNLGDRAAYVRPDFDDSTWQKINLPHDWAITGPFSHKANGSMGHLPTAGIGWYRKKLSIPAEDAGRSIFLDVDGAMAYSTVWLNGQIVGGWPYGYASWRVNLTPYVKPGAVNELVIRLDNPPDSMRWYPGAGIYRNVWLVKTSPVHVAHWGTCITTPQVSQDSATVQMRVIVNNDSTHTADVTVATDIFELDSDGQRSEHAVTSIAPETLEISAKSEAAIEAKGAVANPKLWGPPPQQRPNRYVAVTTVSQDGKVLDRYQTPFGIRTIRFDPDNGFFINDQHVAIKGVCMHHDLGALGAAFNYRAAQRQLEMLQEMGCNALRTSHNPPAPEVMELADKMGILVMDEAYDVWIGPKVPLGFQQIFPDWHEQDLRAMIRRDRNSPSVVLWSIGNEVSEQYSGANGAAIGKSLCDIVHDEDPTRPTTSAMNWAKPDGALPAVVDVIGLNYQGAGIRKEPGKYPAFHKNFHDKPIIGSETACALSTRGAYFFPVIPGNDAVVEGTPGALDKSGCEVSSYELYRVAFGASADKSFAAQEQHPYVAGEFIWTGWDYLGEPMPNYGLLRSSSCGIIDTAGFKKDRFYLYQAHWRPDLPMAHILPHWNWPDRLGQVTPVHVFTSGDEAELFLNGKSLGRKKKGQFEYRLRWDDLVYEPGTLRVVAYKGGKTWAEDTVQTTDNPKQVMLTPDRASIAADGRDLSFVTVRMADQDGLTVPRAMNEVKFKIDGPGEIVATDNGDPSSFDSFQVPQRKAFNGLCLVIVRAKPNQTGAITLTADAEGLQGASVSLQSVPPGNHDPR